MVPLFVSRAWPVLLVFVLATLMLSLGTRAGNAQEVPNAKGIEFFENKIRPVFRKHCYECHSSQGSKMRGGLAIDSKAGLLKGGDSGPALVPGKAKESLIIKALRHNGDLRMPPRSKKLGDDVIDDFERWINMGAPDPRQGQVVASNTIDVEKGRKLWSFQPLAKVAPPAVKNQAWVRTPVDRFILAKLEASNLVPNQQISRERLLRRAYFDLHGLPPTAAELEAFANDSSLDTYEKLLDRLLASERFGERWGRHWLDLVRFAESGGFEYDRERPNAYHYRDFVIKALNQDMSYDQFVRWQIAGDHLRPHDLNAVAATGFLIAGGVPEETAKTRELFRYNRLDDMISTLGSSMLGLTIGCARCHAHKYDPIPQEDYYRLIACLSRIDSDDVNVDPNPEGYRKARAVFDQANATVLGARTHFEKAELPNRIQEFHKIGKENPAWITLAPYVLPGGNAADSANLAPKQVGKGGQHGTFNLQAHTFLKNISGFRIDASPGKKFLPLELQVMAKRFNGTGGEVAIPLKELPSHDNQQPVSSVLYETDGANDFDGGMVLTVSFRYKADEQNKFTVSFATSARPLKLEGSIEPQIRGEPAILLAREKGQFTNRNRSAVMYWIRLGDAEVDKIYQAAEAVEKHAPVASITVFAATSKKIIDVHFLVRGEVEKKGAVMTPGFVQVLMNAADGSQRWTGETGAKQSSSAASRVALADWITDADHGAGHLLARVIVNRLWQHHLGRGIVSTPNDFGAQGERPTHAELLDYLARELINKGWKLKPIHKLIMTSAVYMQAGDVIPANMKTDPQNRLWWRRPARRLEAEAIRDSILAVSGTLDLTMYGPGKFDSNSPRRSVYLTVKRSQLNPLLQTFDAPEPIQSIGERSVTTVPTQSLAFLNSPFVLEAAGKIADRIADKSGKITEETIHRAYMTVLSRRPTPTERQRLHAFFRRQAESYGQTPEARNLAFIDCCQILLCLNEFIFVD
jgi:Protein of unknown function (DUF1553)/Protein of unknown function (DUF1549)/Planctomycete cytochrome C